MAAPILNWPGKNFTFTAPQGRDDVQDLPVFLNRQGIISAWQFSPAERAEIMQTGQVFLFIMGHQMPAVYVASETEMIRAQADFGVWNKA